MPPILLAILIGSVLGGTAGLVMGRKKTAFFPGWTGSGRTVNTGEGGGGGGGNPVAPLADLGRSIFGGTTHAAAAISAAGVSFQGNPTAVTGGTSSTSGTSGGSSGGSGTGIDPGTSYINPSTSPTGGGSGNFTP